MKIIALALLLAIACTLDIKGEDGLVKFEYDPMNNELFGLVMKGQIDPKNELNNKISTFLKLANYYVPVLESIKGESNNLKWNFMKTFSLGPLGTFQASGSFNLVVGWEVWLNQGNSITNGTYFDIVYAPFAWGWATGLLGGQNYLVNGYYNATMYYARTYVNISLQIYGDGDVCFTGTANFWPVQIITGLSSSLSSCYTEILADIIYRNPIALGCNFSTPFNMTHLNVSLTANYTQAVVNNKCFYL